MSLGQPYSTGTVTVGSTTVTGSGVLWTDVLEGDLFYCGGLIMPIGADVVAPYTSLTLAVAWPGAFAGVGLAYQIQRVSYKRYDPAITQDKVRELLATWGNVSGLVDAGATDQTLTLTKAATANNAYVRYRRNQTAPVDLWREGAIGDDNFTIQRYVSAAWSTAVSIALATGIVTAVGLASSALTAGSVVFAGASGLLSQDTSNFVWDNTNKRVGLGVASPTRPLSFANSIAEKIALFAVDGTARNYYGLAIESSTLAYQVPASQVHKFYDGATPIVTFYGGNIGVGFTATLPLVKLVLNNNSSANPVALTPTAGTIAQVIGADGSTNRFRLSSFTQRSAVEFYRANNTGASPTALAANDQIGSVTAFGYGATAYSTARATIQFFAAEAWTDSAQGSYLTLATTPIGSITQAERVRIDPAGYFGINTATPYALFHALRSTAGASAPASSGTADPTVVARFSYASVGLDLGILDGGGSFIQNRNITNLASPFALSLNPTGGDVMIGTSTSLGYKLLVAGTFRATSGVFVGVGSTSATSAFQVYNNSLTQMVNLRDDGALFLLAGNVMIGTSSDGGWSAGAKLESVSPNWALSGYCTAAAGVTKGALLLKVDNPSGNFLVWMFSGATPVGSITTNGTGVTYGTSSDMRLKEDARPIANPGMIIDRLRFYNLRWIASQRREFGTFAQEVYEVFPWAVQRPANDNDPWGVDYSKFVPLFGSELQKLRGRVAQLEAEVAELRAA